MGLFKKQNILQLDDHEIITRYKRSHDKRLIGELYKRYSHLVYGTCLKYLRNEMEAKDAVINIYIKILEDLKTHDVQKFKSWLFMVSKNACLMQIRAANSFKAKEKAYQEELKGSHLEAQEEKNLIKEKEESLVRLEKAIKELKPEQQACIELFYLKELSYGEVSKQTGYSLKEVKSYLQNGKRNLKNILNE